MYCLYSHSFALMSYAYFLHVFTLVFLRTKKAGNLPNLSYIQRKSEPLGTEFKNIVDGMTWTMIWLEIQEGKHWMRHLIYTHDLSGIVACVIKVSHFSHHGQREIESVDTPYLFYGYSWCGSIKVASRVSTASSISISPAYSILISSASSVASSSTNSCASSGLSMQYYTSTDC